MLLNIWRKVKIINSNIKKKTYLNTSTEYEQWGPKPYSWLQQCNELNYESLSISGLKPPFIWSRTEVMHKTTREGGPPVSSHLTQTTHDWPENTLHICFCRVESDHPWHDSRIQEGYLSLTHTCSEMLVWHTRQDCANNKIIFQYFNF